MIEVSYLMKRKIKKIFHKVISNTKLYIVNYRDVRSHNHSDCTAGLYPDSTKSSCIPTWRESRWVDSFLFVTPEKDPGVTREK